MANCRISRFLLSVAIVFGSFFITQTNCTKINAARLLLPYAIRIPTNYTLEVEDGGCYTWSSTRPEVASVAPILQAGNVTLGCSSKALVTTVSRTNQRQSTMVFATEVSTGVMLRTVVDVDRIKSIEIISTTREIILDGVPEIFSVQAKNDHNDTFTCLGGIEFDWITETIKDSGVRSSKKDPSDTNSDNLKFRKFSEFQYKVPPANEYWESKGRHGAFVLIEGIHTGSSRVTAKIKESAYRDVSPAEIQLSVVASCIVVPSLANGYPIPPGAVTKIELGSEIEVRIEILDSSGKPVPISFHRLMNLRPEDLSSDAVTVSTLPVGSDAMTYSSYNVKADKLGIASFTLKTGLNDQLMNVYTKVIVSPELKFEVFSPLRVEPSDVTLIVGAHFEVAVTGGPQSDSSVQYSVANPSVASVSASGLIEASKIGTTKLHAKSVDKISAVVHSQSDITVTVVPLHEVRILVPSEKILIGAEMPVSLLGIGPNGQRLSPLAFGSAFPTLKITWSVDGKESLDLTPIFSKFGVADSSSNQFAARVRGIQDGIANIRVTVEPTSSGGNSLNQQVTGDRVLSNNVTLTVFGKAAVVHVEETAPYNVDTKTGLLLLSAGSELPLKSTRDAQGKVKYEIRASNPRLTLDKTTSILRASPLSTGVETANLELEFDEPFGLVQRVNYSVSVQKVAYLMVSAVAGKALPSKNVGLQNRLLTIPLGSSVELDIGYFNSIGQRFDAITGSPKGRLSRSDKVTLDWVEARPGPSSRTVVITTREEGLTLLRIWHLNNEDVAAKKSPSKATPTILGEDYIYINVDRIIVPRTLSHVTVGDVVCFSSPLSSAEGQESWTSEDARTLFFVKSQPGVAIAKGPGTVRVRQDVGSIAPTSHDIAVSTPRELRITPNTGITHLTNVVSGLKQVTFSVHVTKESTAPATMVHGACDRKAIAQLEAPFECSVSFTAVESAVSASDVFNCDISLDGDLIHYIVTLQLKDKISNDINAYLSTLNTQVSLQVSLKGSALRPAKLELPFYPAFNVQRRHEPLVLSNSDEQSTQYITLSGVPAVLRNSLQVTSGSELARQMLDILPLEFVASSTSRVSEVKIPVQLKKKKTSEIKFAGEPLTVKIFSTLTKQTELVNVQLNWMVVECAAAQDIPATAEAPVKLEQPPPSLREEYAKLPLCRSEGLPVEARTEQSRFVQDNQQMATLLLCIALVSIVVYQLMTKKSQATTPGVMYSTESPQAQHFVPHSPSFTSPGGRTMGSLSSTDSNSPSRLVDYSGRGQQPQSPMPPASGLNPGQSSPKGRPLWSSRS